MSEGHPKSSMWNSPSVLGMSRGRFTHTVEMTSQMTRWLIAFTCRDLSCGKLKDSKTRNLQIFHFVPCISCIINILWFIFIFQRTMCWGSRRKEPKARRIQHWWVPVVAPRWQLECCCEKICVTDRTWYDWIYNLNVFYILRDKFKGKSNLDWTYHFV